MVNVKILNKYEFRIMIGRYGLSVKSTNQNADLKSTNQNALIKISPTDTESSIHIDSKIQI